MIILLLLVASMNLPGSSIAQIRLTFLDKLDAEMKMKGRYILGMRSQVPNSGFPLADHLAAGKMEDSSNH